ncbi:unnamed protein product, partial [Ectocarpus sp. 13 AM-2016]
MFNIAYTSTLTAKSKREIRDVHLSTASLRILPQAIRSSLANSTWASCMRYCFDTSALRTPHLSKIYIGPATYSWSSTSAAASDSWKEWLSANTTRFSYSSWAKGSSLARYLKPTRRIASLLASLSTPTPPPWASISSTARVHAQLLLGAQLSGVRIEL